MVTTKFHFIDTVIFNSTNYRYTYISLMTFVASSNFSVALSIFDALAFGASKCWCRDDDGKCAGFINLPPVNKY